MQGDPADAERFGGCGTVASGCFEGTDDELAIVVASRKGRADLELLTIC